MAIDTRKKRLSMLSFGGGDLLPDVDGSIDAGDRLTYLGLYRGIAAALPRIIKRVFGRRRKKPARLPELVETERLHEVWLAHVRQVETEMWAGRPRPDAIRRQQEERARTQAVERVRAKARLAPKESELERTIRPIVEEVVDETMDKRLGFGSVRRRLRRKK